MEKARRIAFVLQLAVAFSVALSLTTVPTVARAGDIHYAFIDADTAGGPDAWMTVTWSFGSGTVPAGKELVIGNVLGTGAWTAHIVVDDGAATIYEAKYTPSVLPRLYFKRGLKVPEGGSVTVWATDARDRCLTFRGILQDAVP